MEKKFSINEELRIPRARLIKLHVDWAIKRHPNMVNVISDFIISPAKCRRENLWNDFIDLKNHVVFNGSDLGKEYSANAIMERCGIKPELEKQNIKSISFG